MSVFDDLRAERVVLDPLSETILRASGVRTAEDLHSLLTAFPSLAVNFRIPSAQITGALAPAFSAAYAAVAAHPPQRQPPGMGASAPPGTIHAVGTVAGILPQPSIQITNPQITGATRPIDNRLPAWPVRNQGQRGTCVAFGSTACIEHHFSQSEPQNPDYSEQFLYYQIKTASGDPGKNQDGTWLQYARDMLSTQGICHERFDPYVGPAPINPVSGAAPSKTAVADAQHNKVACATYQRRPGSPATLILSLLQKGHPVAASFPVFDDPISKVGNWFTNVGWLYGRVFDPPVHSVASGGHCVCITGFVPDQNEPTGGYFIFRNSWDTAWSSNSPSPGNSYAPEAGYGEISATYVDNYCWELLQA